MSRVKPFASPAYLLRRGSLDKVAATRFAELGEFFEMRCPSCASTLCVDASLLPVSPEFECAGCGAQLALRPDGTLSEDSTGPRRAQRKA